MFNENFFKQFDTLFTETKRTIGTTNNTETHKEIEFELPRYKKEDLEIDVLDRDLVIKTAEKLSSDKLTAFSYRLTLSQTKPLNLDALEAKLEDGVLLIKIPFAEPMKKKRFSIF